MLMQKTQQTESWLTLKRTTLKASRRSQDVQLNFFTKSHIPAFNRDGIHYTPAFILPLDYNDFNRSTTHELNRFMDRMEKEREKQSHLVMLDTLKVTPSTSHYCQICKCYYGNYTTHTEHPIHLRKLSDSKGQKLIFLLLREISESLSKTKKIVKKAKKRGGSMLKQQQVGQMYKKGDQTSNQSLVVSNDRMILQN